MNKVELITQFSNFLDTLTTHGCDQFKHLSDKVDSIHSNYDQRLESVVLNLGDLESKMGGMLDDIASLKDEFTNYQKVSIVKNLNQQLFERNIELDHLKKKIEKFEDACSPTANTEEVEEVVEEEAVEEEVVEEETEAVEEEVVEEAEAEEEETVEEETEVVEEAEAVEEAEVVEETEAVEEEEETEAVEEETEAVEEETEAVEEEEEDAVGLVEKMLKHPSDKKKKTYFVTDDDDRDIYAVLENGDPSDEPVGKLVGKTGRAKWF